MDEKKLFRMALNLSDPPWHVTAIDFDQSEGRIDIHIDFRSGSSFLCPECSSECPVHDTIEREWRPLNFFQYRAYIHAREPRIRCPEHGVKTVSVPWARKGSGFTLSFEAMVTMLASEMPVSAVS
jgi:transposase